MADESSRHQIKLLIIGLFIILGLVAVMAITAWSAIWICYSDEIKTVESVKKISDRPVVEINYTGDYKFKEYLRYGSGNILETEKFLEDNLCKGLENFVSEGYKCSAFFAQTPEGDYILARNMDYEGSTLPAILKLNTKGIIKSLGISSFNHMDTVDPETLIEKFEAIYTPYLTYDGMNEFGLSVAAISAADSYSVAQSSKVTIYDIEVVRLLLDEAKDVKDAKRIIKNYNVALSDEYPSHFIVCDAKGESIVIEYVSGSMQITECKDKYQVLTDFLLCTGERASDNGAEVYEAYEKALDKVDGRISTEDAMELLKENAVEGKSQWSVVYNMTKKCMAVSFSGDKERVYNYSFGE